MRYFNRIIIIINTLLFIIAGVFMIAVSVNTAGNALAMKTSESFISYMNSATAAWRVAVFVTGAFLVAIALLTIIGNIENRRLERTVVLQSDLGDIYVSMAALEDFSRVIKNLIPGVKDIKGKVYSRNKRIDVIARVVLYSDRPVADVTQEIQEEAIRYIRNTLGIDTPVKPTVIVSKVTFRQAEK